MRLYVLPNGDAIDPRCVTAVVKLDKVSTPTGSYPYRIRVDYNDNIALILAEDESECNTMRDTIIKDINALLEEYDF